MHAVIITIGNEILSGDTLDTNSAYLAQRLGDIGLRVSARYTVPDEAGAIRAALRRGLGEAGLVITTGGLGPTRDDITLAAAAAELGLELVVDEEQARRVREVFARRAIEMPTLNESQFLRLAGATIVYNPSGTAPGQLIAVGGGHLCLLPGVPREVRELWEAGIGEAVRRLAVVPHTRLKRTVRTVGISESVLAQRLEEAGMTAELDQAGVELAYLPRHGLVDLRLTRFSEGEDPSAAERFERMVREIEAAVGGCVYGRDADTLSGAVGRRLRELKLSLGTAESCTGGGIGDWLTDVPGSSDYYVGGVIAYSNEIKARLLGVPPETLERHGAVSRETAAVMALGALDALDCDLALSTTGVAGPDGGSVEKPVGTVYVGLAQRSQTLAGWPSERGRLLEELQRAVVHDDPGGRFLFTRQLKLTGDRELVRRRTVIHALDTLRRRLAD